MSDTAVGSRAFREGYAQPSRQARGVVSVPRSVPEYLVAGKDPERPALIMSGEERSYGEVIAGSLTIAQWLVRSGAHKGERVTLLAENGYFWVIAYLGTLLAGMVSVPLAPTIENEDLRDILGATEPAFALVQAKLLRRVGVQLANISCLTDRQVSASNMMPTAENMTRLPVDAGLPPVFEDDLAAVIFTSGSTGRPRGVMLSHSNIIANTDSIVEYLRLTPRDRVMTVLPFYYCFGTSLLHTHLRAGGTLVIHPGIMYPQRLLERMGETECTGFAGVPSHYQIILRRSSLKKMRFPHLRYVQQAGGHLAPSFIRELREALPSVQIFIMYGQTEATARLSYLPPELIETKAGSVGKGIPGVKLQVVNEGGQPVQPGEIGEIVAEGSNIAKGYWRAAEETAAKFRVGKLYTGDLATIDDEGFIYIVDRASDFLKCGGKRVSCSAIEEVLLEFAGLLEAAVISMPDEVLGEAPKAFVVTRNGDGANLKRELQDFCKLRLPLPLVPKQILIVDSLPKNGAGKVLKSVLKEMPNPMQELVEDARSATN
ncbi:MAG: AMP-binding protein [Deltaproteobacteria bacterium]|nr:AMP-binding protein [Deltaproteobacteria bacterium]